MKGHWSWPFSGPNLLQEHDPELLSDPTFRDALPQHKPLRHQTADQPSSTCWSTTQYFKCFKSLHWTYTTIYLLNFLIYLFFYSISIYLLTAYYSLLCHFLIVIQSHIFHSKAGMSEQMCELDLRDILFCCYFVLNRMRMNLNLNLRICQSHRLNSTKHFNICQTIKPELPMAFQLRFKNNCGPYFLLW